jgi:hypothetical protein
MVGVDPDDARLKPFTNRVFHFTVFNEQKFGDDHYHCIGCWRTIADPTHENTLNEGYVTIHKVQYTGFPISTQYAWACNDCFAKYSGDYGWQVSSEAVPAIPDEINRPFDAAYKEYLARKQGEK